MLSKVLYKYNANIPQEHIPIYTQLRFSADYILKIGSKRVKSPK